MVEEDTLSGGPDAMKDGFPESPIHLSRYSTESKILSECYDVLVAQKEKLRSAEPASAGMPFREVGETVRSLKRLCSSPILTTDERSLARQCYWRR